MLKQISKKQITVSSHIRFFSSKSTLIHQYQQND